MRTWMIVSSIVLTVWYALLYVGVPGLCGRLRLREPQDLLNHLLMAALLAELGLEIVGWRYAASGMLLILLIWGALQFRAHWLPYLRGAPPDAVRRYYHAFGQYVYLLPHGEGRIVPDAYHTVMHVLMLTTFAVCLWQVPIK